MRIISGKYKSRKVEFKMLKGLRPTLDRVKESIYNILFNHIDIKNKMVLDGFAGTGSLGLEALSRGAAKVYFIEKNPEIFKLLKKNCKTFDNSDKIILYENKFYKKLDHFTKRNIRLDLILLDPPYKKGYINDILSNKKFINISKKGAIVVCEVEKNMNINYNNDIWNILANKDYSQTSVIILKKIGE